MKFSRIPLGEKVKVLGGYAFKSEEFAADGLPILRISNIVGNGTVDLSKDVVYYPNSNKLKGFQLDDGDIVIAMSGATTGKVGRIKKGQTRCFLNQRVGKFVLQDEEILSDYLFWILRSPIYQKAIWSFAAGCAQPNISASQLESIKIPIPSNNLQEKIASLLTKAEFILEKRRQTLRLADEFLKSAFLEMFGDPIMNKKEWGFQELEKACLSKGEYGSGAAAIEYDPQKPRYIRITDINEKGDLNIDKVSPNTEESEWEKYMLKEGDILFARSGATVGKTYRYKKTHGFCIYAGYLIRYKPNPEIIIPDYLFYFTKTEFYKKWVMSKMKTVAQPNINAKQYGNELNIQVPPIELQHNFADLVQKVECLKEKQKQSETQLQILFNSLMQRAFRGDLV